jgi:hypothetical protein
VPDAKQGTQSLAVLDIIPAAETWDRANKQFVLDFWPCFCRAFFAEEKPVEIGAVLSDFFTNNAAYQIL